MNQQTEPLSTSELRCEPQRFFRPKQVRHANVCTEKTINAEAVKWIETACRLFLKGILSAWRAPHYTTLLESLMAENVHLSRSAFVYHKYHVLSLETFPFQNQPILEQLHPLTGDKSLGFWNCWLLEDSKNDTGMRAVRISTFGTVRTISCFRWEVPQSPTVHHWLDQKYEIVIFRFTSLLDPIPPQFPYISFIILLYGLQ